MLTRPPTRGAGTRTPRISRRRVAWWARGARRVAAAACVAAAVTLVLRLAFPPPAPTGVLVPVAARDLPVGHVIAGPDVTTRRWPGPDAPRHDRIGRVEDLVGRTLAGPVAAGDVLSARSLVGPSRLLGLPPGQVATTVSGLDPVVRSALQVGDRVQLWAGPHLVSAAAPVLALDLGASAAGGLTGSPGPPDGGSALVALRPSELRELRSARASSPDPAPVEVVLVAPQG